MTRRLIALFRAARLALHIAYGLFLAVSYPWFGLAIRRRILQRWSTGLLDIFNVRIEIDRDDPLHRLHHGLIVTNHISWLDVFVLNAVVPMRFVAKSEVRRWPAIGWLCARAQTLFIERGKARSAARINVQLVDLLQRGECLAIFPEGTTTDGSKVAHFHSSLLQPAIDAGALVHPIAIRYQDRYGAHNLASAYIDEMSFGASMWNILSEPELHVRLVATPPLDASGTDRRNLTRAVHHHIGATLAGMHAIPVMSQTPESPEHVLARMEADLHFQSLYCVLLDSSLAQEAAQQPAK
ncbi:lysophospholipid acyltransferase family protein [Sideroxydans lithotrophicus]|uniref:Phospholipid/glycerol acyltransferase n=1 Tax=Sideroxydans lithotrophicus (strain ES-1) TaxID=580332 RepID=D5CML7_SIDLE|nr:lysophospholipid acyltransferase family protein [Sideroxydans lithotrophicus]ADE12689.1 phospholipid/glycerol acyltransferase [Sideroxydans lithotrophicus ES-1]